MSWRLVHVREGTEKCEGEFGRRIHRMPGALEENQAQKKGHEEMGQPRRETGDCVRVVATLRTCSFVCN